MKRSYESQLEEGLRDREQQVYLRDVEISRLRSQVAELVAALTDVIDGGECVWSDGYICPVVTPVLKRQAKAAIAVAEGGGK